MIEPQHLMVINLENLHGKKGDKDNLLTVHQSSPLLSCPVFACLQCDLIINRFLLFFSLHSTNTSRWRLFRNQTKSELVWNRTDVMQWEVLSSVLNWPFVPCFVRLSLNYSPSHNRLTHPQTVHCRWFICTFPIYGHNSSTSKNNKSTSKEQQQQDKLITLNYRRSSTNKSKRVTTDGGGGISFESMICSADGKTNNLLREVINWRLPSSSATLCD